MVRQLSTEQTSSPRRRTILFVSGIADMYGGERSLLPIVERLGPSWLPRFVIPGPGRLMKALCAAHYPYDVLALHHGLGPRAFIKRLFTVLRLWRLLKRHHVDLVHLNLHFAAPLVVLSCFLARIPLVVHVRNIEDRDRSYLYRYLFRRARAYICISQAVVRRLLETRLLSDKELGRVQRIPDGRDISLYDHGDRERIRREFGIEDQMAFVGMIARIEPMKGHDIFLEMASLVAREVPAARFVVVGNLIGDMHREYMQRLIDLQRTLGFDKRLTFAGYREDIPDILAALDCFVHPSHRGAFVSVLIEAMAAGTPIVASDVDGIPECVGRNSAAELVHPIEPALFAEAVVGVLKDPQRARMMGQAGRERAKKYFDAAPLALQTEEVLKAALEVTAKQSERKQNR